MSISNYERKIMSDKLEEQILRAAKEIIVKYIEVGRISPAAFPENFQKVYQGIYDTVMKKTEKR